MITASAGDDGYYSYDLLSGVNQPSIPAAYNTTVSVGGTSLNLGQTATRQSESVWNDNGPRDVLEQGFAQPLGRRRRLPPCSARSAGRPRSAPGAAPDAAAVGGLRRLRRWADTYT